MSSDAAVELHGELLEAVGRLRSSSQWLEAMTAAARFRDYSLGNWLLLWTQAEQRGTEVTRPAGYRMWQRLGRQVEKGERGYRILAPLTRRITDPDTDDTDGKGTRRVVTGFRVVTVFDISQTTGDPLPEVGPVLLTGEGHAALLDAAVGLIENRGYRFRLGQLRSANGVTRPDSREVIVADHLAGAQRTKTTVHELAHVLLHTNNDGGGDELVCRGRIEVEAEAIAYVVCAAAGLDTSAYSVAYVAGWAEHTEDPDRALLATGERIVATARSLLTELNDSDVFVTVPSDSKESPLEIPKVSDRITMSDVSPVGMEGRGVV